uniref:Isopenicillin N synthase-like Fe(2+) 2OG dioxygenase domain-containing protein n=2 Tax=Kalanchoe fedtschenkoi TaxID=63787 RepID=A0A7N0TUC8_KALFE
MEEQQPEIFTLVELHYSDILQLSSESIFDSPIQERQRLESISRTIMETLGPKGPGILSVTGVPNASRLRRMLLPLARKLALLNHQDRKRILKEHRLGSDVPLKSLDRNVSSFAMKLEYSKGSELVQNMTSHERDLSLDINLEEDGGGKRRNDFENLCDAFEQLGQLMINLGILLARICDRFIGGHELEQSLLESSTAKGRLIHYHSVLDNVIIQEKEARQKKATTKSRPKYENRKGLCINSGVPPVEAHQLNTNQTEADGMTGLSNLWQQWHYDYGMFTVLTDPMFLSSCGSRQTLEEWSEIPQSNEHETLSLIGHTCLQVLDTHRNKLVSVKSSPESFIIQVGESADILSRGELRATLHSVSRPRKLENLSRETFVVFLQPAWNKIFNLQNHSAQRWTDSDARETGDNRPGMRSQCKLVGDIQNRIPPLFSRLKDGMTFAEFSRETTKQYYGGSGLQSNK